MEALRRHLSGGLGELIKQFQQNGQGDKADFVGSH